MKALILMVGCLMFVSCQDSGRKVVYQPVAENMICVVAKEALTVDFTSRVKKHETTHCKKGWPIMAYTLREDGAKVAEGYNKIISDRWHVVERHLDGTKFEYHQIGCDIIKTNAEDSIIAGYYNHVTSSGPVHVGHGDRSYILRTPADFKLMRKFVRGETNVAPESYPTLGPGCQRISLSYGDGKPCTSDPDGLCWLGECIK